MASLALFTCSYLPNPSVTSIGVTQDNFLCRLKLVWILSFLLHECLYNFKEPSLSHYLTIAGRKTNRFISFPRKNEVKWITKKNKKKTHIACICTQITDSISYVDIRYGKHSLFFYKSHIMIVNLFTNIRGAYDKFPDFFVWTLLLIIHTWNSSPLRNNLLRLQCTCCTVPTTSGRPYGSPFVWAYQWPSSQPLSSPQLSHNDRLWA